APRGRRRRDRGEGPDCSLVVGVEGPDPGVEGGAAVGHMTSSVVGSQPATAKVTPSGSRFNSESDRAGAASRSRAGGGALVADRRIQGNGGANERLEGLVVDLVSLLDDDGAHGVAFEA